MPNAELIRAGIDWAREEAEKGDAGVWDQDWWIARSEVWTCGTKRCLAGNMVITAGWVPVWTSETRGFLRYEATYVRHPETGRVRDVEDLAVELADLTAAQADALFAGGNRLRDLYRVANEITDGAIPVPAGPLPDGS